LQTQATKSVLIVKGNSDYSELIRDMFKNQGPYSFTVTQVSSMEDARTQLASFPFDVILLDLEFADAHGQKAVRQIRTVAPRVAIVLLAALEDESTAIKSMQEGA
jgi:two-component system phosphate regulon response regulator OmpR